ncbi:hypothetical protein CRE_28458 [Caenorhabditis remanei]|uniref:Methyltransferase FkbM domain-containing protein n=1 Tax=Caenorhabditis remanei TaxID=31234 RepID=E3LMJ2_CAERE|nr:hypothetical protein CRE_28458 [Caenorhabditis remanei]
MSLQRILQFLVLFSVFFICFKVKTTKEVEADDSDQQTLFLVANKSEIFEDWRTCAKYKLMGFEDPSEEDQNHNLITLGIGQDTSAEERYQKKMQKLGKIVDFFGADPMVELNSEIYSRIGKYFPFAVARHAGFSNASIQKNGEYLDQNVAHVDILYFFKQILDVEKIDNLWIDAEGAEYELFEIFEKNGVLDQNDIVVCQANMEIHISEAEGHLNPNFEKQKIFMDFVKKIITEKKYGIFRASEEFHMRIYLFNFESEYCRNKY